MPAASFVLRRQALAIPAANLSVRALGLAMRLGLVVYLARFLDMDAVGQFGLIQGAASLAPVVLGWGVTYYLGRELVGRPPLEAGRLVRDRLLLTIASLAAVGAVLAALIVTETIEAPRALPWIAAILFLESLAFDLHFALISVGKPVAANFLLFVRSGLWVFPAAGLGLAFPTLRTLDFVLLCWTLALIANFGALLPILAAWPLAAIARARIDRDWIAARMRGSKLIYLNDLGIVGMTYLDRYIVHSMLDLRATGIFVLHWAIANAVHVLVTAATVQVSLPALVSAYRQGDGPWRIELSALVLRVLAIGAPLALLVFAVAVFGLPLVSAEALPISGPLLALMLVSSVIRLVGDGLNYGLYSRGLDRSLAGINILGAVTAVLLSVVLLPRLGLVGVGLAMVLNATLLLAARAAVLAARHRIGPAERADG
ncbi:lipopolysaccharide biosynthesis protein [Kaistia defluvii]|uniref:O-antigen/teichoic acid export membrane protein n=1 Tax=Kaistia defluvii TaxID=410841 RepID=A0ABV2R3X8_9HYPH